MADISHDKVFPKQAKVFLAGKKSKYKKNKKGIPRYYRNIGLGFKTVHLYVVFTFSQPKRSKELTLTRKCPFTGNVSIRGRILKGLVVSNKMQRTIIMRRDYLHFVKKYRRYEKRHTNISCHLSPCFSVKEGDVVTVGQCRPLSKTVRFNVLKVEPCSTQKPVNIKKQFRMF